MDEIWINDFRYFQKKVSISRFGHASWFFRVFVRKWPFYNFYAESGENYLLINFYVFSEKKVSISDFLNFSVFLAFLCENGRFWSFYAFLVVFGRFVQIP